jgi:hypothetical protein
MLGCQGARLSLAAAFSLATACTFMLQATSTVDKTPPWVMLPSQRDLFLQDFASAAQQAVCRSATIDCLKLR